MYIEMELLARERYETRLREAAESHRNRIQLGPEHTQARSARHLPLPRMRRK